MTSEVKNSKSGTDGTQPQYRYVAPIEDSSVVQRVISRTLDSDVTLTQRELLSLSSDLRRQMKELTTSKRIPIGGINLVGGQAPVLSTSIDSSPAEPVLCTRNSTAPHMLPLRVVTVVMEEKVEYSAVLDQGAVVCLMREDVWRNLEVPLEPDRRMTLESADTGKSPTLGVVQNARLRIAGVVVMLQIHVVRNAPFEILLGRPFFAVTECETKDFENGDQYITLTDPMNCSRRCQIATGIRTVDVPTDSGF